jgi:hypothetical protein
MAAESTSAATQRSSKSLQRLIDDNGLEALQKLPTPDTDDAGYFDGRPGHECRCRHMTKTLHRLITRSKAKTAATAAPVRLRSRRHFDGNVMMEP